MSVTLAELCGLADDESPRPRPYRPLIVHPPAPGVAVLACRCGKVIDAAGMHRLPGPGNGSIPPIVCGACARNRAW